MQYKSLLVISPRRLNSLLLPARPAPRQHALQKRPGITAFLLHVLVRRTRGYDLAATVTRVRIKSGPRFGAEVDELAVRSLSSDQPQLEHLSIFRGFSDIAALQR